MALDATFMTESADEGLKTFMQYLQNFD